MYIPGHFREDRPDVLYDAMRRIGFATLVTQEAKRGLDANTRRSQEELARRAPAILTGLARYAVNMMDRDLERGGGFTYRIYLFVKD